MSRVIPKCKDCNGPYGPFFLWLDDELWKRIECESNDFVCAHCIIERLMERGIWYVYAAGGEGSHSIRSASVKIDVTQKKSKDFRRQLIDSD